MAYKQSSILLRASKTTPKPPFPMHDIGSKSEEYRDTNGKIFSELESLDLVLFTESLLGGGSTGGGGIMGS